MTPFEGKNYRTLWYGYIDLELTDDLLVQLSDIMKDDVQSSEVEPIEATHWVFYSANEQQDALEEPIRSSLMVRYQNKRYNVHYNMSDFEFVTGYDALMKFLTHFEVTLNQENKH